MKSLDILWKLKVGKTANFFRPVMLKNNLIFMVNLI